MSSEDPLDRHLSKMSVLLNEVENMNMEEEEVETA